jgi:signal transduction histidine kinase
MLAGLLLCFWMERTAWRALNRIEGELAAVHTESFSLGLHLRAGIWRLDACALRFQLSGDIEERVSFQNESRSLTALIERTKPLLATDREQGVLLPTETAFSAYLTSMAPFLEKSARGIRRGTSEQLAGEIATVSAPVLRQCELLVQARREAWEAVMAESQVSLRSLETLMHISAGSLLVLLGASLVLGHRLFVRPLRSRLDESRMTLERQEKLASLGTLAAGVAHEIRNPLAAIKFRLFSLKNSLPAANAESADLRIIGEEINRLERIVRDFLQFARPSEPQLSGVDAAALLDEVRELVQATLDKQSIRLAIEPVTGLEITVDKEQIKQVLLNLVQNAAASIGQNSGTITLRARRGAAQFGAKNAPAAILEVTDTGGGIPLEVEARLFDPFFSTREGGTGLGLPIAARIVEKHGGQIQYQTQPGRGATFSVVLPRATDHAKPDSAH